MIIATYNIQNIFHRENHLINQFRENNKDYWTMEFENLLTKEACSDKDFERMRVLSNFLELDTSQNSHYITMRHKSGDIRIKKSDNLEPYKSNHLTNWNGWIKLNSSPIDEIAIRNKARVINNISPDVLILLEVENRKALIEFNQYFLSKDNGFGYKHILYFETNDAYGRGIGILTKEGYQITSIKTHVNDLDLDGNPIFDTDLQEYELKTVKGYKLNLLSTFFTNGFDGTNKIDIRRKKQAKIIAELYRNIKETNSLVAIMGTFNAPPYSDSLSPLVRDTDLKNITKHDSFEVDLDKGKDADYFRMGAYKMGVNIKQRDYLMFSSKLFDNVKKGGIVRKGIWFKKQPQWHIFNTIKHEGHAASEHPLVWSELNI
ncbi:hypothetical protein [Flavivirga jejuensis]|uniref:Endonuclease/exonuclease/phosphatase domain-containing protein n=1 Tax=Flavivirga jejuensis TaxID=870487 RepID=A0ABT8WVD8_9FLAO|nr:hypothetical protein [Flavivirga jejuensis]MDO5976959.1 hypothetical protein [Flavivirga jejuensis]